jgi:hypothetical protein
VGNAHHFLIVSVFQIFDKAMLFRPKKVNKGFDRIFLVLAIIAGISFGFYVGVKICNMETRESIWDFLPSYSTHKPGETKEEKEIRDRQWEAFKKAEPSAHELLRKRKQQLEKEGYWVSFLELDGKEVVVTTDPDAPVISYYPPISRCIVFGAIFGGVSFLIALLSLRGLNLLVLWIKQGFNEKYDE